MKRLLILGLLLALSAPAFASLDMTSETGTTQKNDQEQSLSNRKSRELKQSETKRKSKSKSTGLDKQTQDAIRRTEQAQASRTLEATVSLDQIIMQAMADLEYDPSYPVFYEAKLLTNPKQPVDFGIGRVIERNGWPVSSAQSGFEALAKTQAPIQGHGIKEGELREKRNQATFYGITGRQSIDFLMRYIQEAGGEIKDGDKPGESRIANLGYEDVLALTEAAVRSAAETKLPRSLDRLYQRIVRDQTPGVFAGSVERIKFGSSVLSLTIPPKLSNAGVEIFGKSFCGMTGTYRVNSGWSLSSAIEAMKSTTKYAKWAKEVSKAAEELEAQGRTKEASLMRKRAWDRMRSGKSTIGVGRLLPNFN